MNPLTYHVTEAFSRGIGVRVNLYMILLCSYENETIGLHTETLLLFRMNGLKL